jgi:hypothetical protein
MGLASIPHNNYGRKIEQSRFPQYERIREQAEHGDEAKFQ